MITSLSENQVFVFGSNAQGFHGAGAAGMACRGDSRNNWRQDQWFLDAIAGTNNRVGKWAIFGQARGFQRGKEGMSYAVQTIIRPGQRCSTSRREIYHQLVELWQFARANPQWQFLVCPLGEGYAGWSHEQMLEVWQYLQQQHGLPENITFIGRDAGVSMT